MQFSLLFVIVAAILVLVLSLVLARNAIAIKRDLDQRFDRFQNRLENDATKAIEPLLRGRADEHDPG